MILINRKRNRKKVLVLWYPVDINLGDYYIFQTVRNYLTEWNCEIVDMDVGLPYTIIAQEAKKCDWLWFAGGGIIERGIPDIILNFDKFHAKSKNVRYGITGLSIGGYKYDESSEALSYWVKKAEFFYTRDAFSADELNRISRTSIVVPSVDVVFAYKGFPKSRNATKGYFGVNLRTMPYPDLSGELQWKEWSNTIINIHASKIFGIPDQFDFSGKVDFEMIDKYTPEKVIEAINEIDYGLAMRFHVVLIAARLGKVCIPICYCPKVRRLAEQLGISDLCLDANGYNELENMVNMYLSKEEYYIGIIRENVKKMELQAEVMFTEVKKIMEE